MTHAFSFDPRKCDSCLAFQKQRASAAQATGTEYSKGLDFLLNVFKDLLKAWEIWHHDDDIEYLVISNIEATKMTQRKSHHIPEVFYQLSLKEPFFQ